MKKHKRMQLLARIPLGLLLAAMVLMRPLGSGRAEGTWTTLTETDETGTKTADRLAGDFSGEVRITFLGDCTLGGLENKKNSSLGFVRRIEENGLDFPFRNLRTLTENDDLTVANLEGVLSDRKLKKVKKEYNFIGPTAYTEILQSGSIECVTVANNHSHDYGKEGIRIQRTRWTGPALPGLGRTRQPCGRMRRGCELAFWASITR